MNGNILNNSRNIMLCLLLVFFIGTGCRARRGVPVPKVNKTKSEAATSSKSELLRTIRERQADFSTMSIKAKANLSINNRDNDVSMNIRIRKDQALWVSVTAFAGIEVARALITPDSVKIVNRVENTYVDAPFDYIHRYTNDQIDFRTIQALLIGNCVPDFISEESTVDVQNSQAALNGFMKGLIYSVNFNPAIKVIQTNLKDENAGQQLTASYSDFTLISRQQIPQSIDISSIAGKKNVKLQLSYNQIAINEALEFPFSIPKRFTLQNK